MCIISKENIVVNANYETKDDLFKGIGQLALQNKRIDNIADFVQGLYAREAECSTGFERGIAIPHTLNKTVKQPTVFIVKNCKDIIWDDEGSLMNFIVCLAIPEGGGAEHLKILSSIARKLVDEDFTDKLLSCDTSEKIYDLLKNITL